MGTWGTGPFDSDNAADLMGSIESEQETPEGRLHIAEGAVSALLQADDGTFEDLARYSDARIDEGIAAAAFLTDLARWNLGRGGGWQDGYRKWTNTPYADDVDFADVAKPERRHVSDALEAVLKVRRYVGRRYPTGGLDDHLDDYKAMLVALEKDLTEIAYGNN